MLETNCIVRSFHRDRAKDRSKAPGSTLDTLPTSRGASYLAFDVLDLYRQKERLLSDYLLTATSLYRQKLIPAIGPIEKRNLADFNKAIAAFTYAFATKKTVIKYI